MKVTPGIYAGGHFVLKLICLFKSGFLEFVDFSGFSNFTFSLH